ncbi:MAG: transposase, partial [Bacteroidetes bacterium]|nr:transposase [Bacteroidota bacterium]
GLRDTNSIRPARLSPACLNRREYVYRSRLPQTNAKVERMNGKIQEVKTVGRGYRKFENFRSAILFFCGDLALYPQQS